MSKQALPLIGLIGAPFAGKSTVATILTQAQPNYSIAELKLPLLNAAQALDPLVRYRGTVIKYTSLVKRVGYDRSKLLSEDVRPFLQRVGDVLEYAGGADILVRKLVEREPEVNGLIVTDVRTAAQLDWVRSEGGIIIRVDRAGKEADLNHNADSFFLTVEPDFVLENNSESIATLQKQVYDLYDQIVLRSKNEKANQTD